MLPKTRIKLVVGIGAAYLLISAGAFAMGKARLHKGLVSLTRYQGRVGKLTAVPTSFARDRGKACTVSAIKIQQPKTRPVGAIGVQVHLASQAWWVDAFDTEIPHVLSESKGQTWLEQEFGDDPAGPMRGLCADSEDRIPHDFRRYVILRSNDVEIGMTYRCGFPNMPRRQETTICHFD